MRDQKRESSPNKGEGVGALVSHLWITCRGTFVGECLQRGNPCPRHGHRKAGSPFVAQTTQSMQYCTYRASNGFPCLRHPACHLGTSGRPIHHRTIPSESVSRSCQPGSRCVDFQNCECIGSQVVSTSRDDM